MTDAIPEEMFGHELPGDFRDLLARLAENHSAELIRVDDPQRGEARYYDKSPTDVENGALLAIQGAGFVIKHAGTTDVPVHGTEDVAYTKNEEDHPAGERRAYVAFRPPMDVGGRTYAT